MLGIEVWPSSTGMTASQRRFDLDPHQVVLMVDPGVAGTARSPGPIRARRLPARCCREPARPRCGRGRGKSIRGGTLSMSRSLAGSDEPDRRQTIVFGDRTWNIEQSEARADHGCEEAHRRSAQDAKQDIPRHAAKVDDVGECCRDDRQSRDTSRRGCIHEALAGRRSLGTASIPVEE